MCLHTFILCSVKMINRFNLTEKGIFGLLQLLSYFHSHNILTYFQEKSKMSPSLYRKTLCTHNYGK